ncbi:MAG: YbaB/EbfC family nucleoid-associated protein [Ureaplasma sp.]|nr:YbaB/EbfC family nucleoid-associated protein [Ureaplasma sp.]MDE6289834.1 YbaB/EbfC family nucleoid-associated protein [Ureaplasma sp.]
MNIQQMMQQAQKLQNSLKKKMQEFEQTTFEHKYKEFVTIKLTGALKIESISINKEIVDPDDLEMLNDIVTAAVNEAVTKVVSEKDKITSSLAPGMGGLF